MLKNKLDLKQINFNLIFLAFYFFYACALNAQPLLDFERENRKKEITTFKKISSSIFSEEQPEPYHKIFSENINSNNSDSIDNLLSKAVLHGLSINPSVLSAAAKVSKSRIEVDVEKSGYYPSIQTSLGTGSLQDTSVIYEASVRQMLYDWGAVENRVKAAQAAERLSLQELLVAREEAALAIVEIYYDIVFAEQLINFFTSLIERLKVISALSQRRVDAAYSDRSEIMRVVVEINRADEQLLQEKTKLIEAKEKYNILVGHIEIGKKIGSPYTVKEILLKDQDITTLVNKSPLYLKAVEKKNMEEASLLRSTAELKPQLNLEAVIQRRAVGGQPTKDSNISFQLRIPVMQGVSSFQRVKAMRESLTAAQWDIEAMSREIHMKIFSLLKKENPLRDRQQVLQAQITNSQNLSNIYSEQFLLGNRNITDLLTTELSHFEAQRQLINVQNEQHRLVYRAMAQLGLLVPFIEGRLQEKINQ